jgi:hypothetical protein
MARRRGRLGGPDTEHIIAVAPADLKANTRWSRGRAGRPARKAAVGWCRAAARSRPGPRRPWPGRPEVQLRRRRRVASEDAWCHGGRRLGVRDAVRCSAPAQAQRPRWPPRPGITPRPEQVHHVPGDRGRCAEGWLLRKVPPGQGSPGPGPVRAEPDSQPGPRLGPTIGHRPDCRADRSRIRSSHLES